MRMRVAIARSLVDDPTLLLMDEPFAALDEMTRFDLNEQLRRMRAVSGASLIFVTHSITEAVFLSDRIVVLSPRPGQIATTLTPGLPEQRDGDLRHDPDFLRICAEVSRALRSASTTAA
jgi:NitT/TauT family transport system ATP-binding protein